MGLFRSHKSYKCPVCGAIHEGDEGVTRTRLRLVGAYTEALCPDCDEESRSGDFLNPDGIFGDED